ncbi:amylo-alpha-1,6-glucosidase [Dongia deserti]|uniref:amylo-alpha-1,6-glucosidase n=1 Tax=Dongia deserti TaxID=2268030 RepID=UPI0025490562|nr:amylo-alpha-1,6-glucosidase [Dongia deserti]
MQSVHVSPPPLAGDAGAGVISAPQFYIPATTSLQERRPRTLKHGDMFAVFDHHGDAIGGPGSTDGIYYQDTRYLSWFQLRVSGLRPLLLGSTLRGDNATLTCDLTNPDIDEPDSPPLEHDLVHLRRSCFLWNATCYQRLLIRNFDLVPHALRIQFVFAADFADIFEARGTRRERRGTIHGVQLAGRVATLAYTGLDGRRRQTQLVFDAQPTRLTADQADFTVTLKPHETASLFIEIRCDPDNAVDGATSGRFVTAMRDARRALRRSSGRAAAVATSNDILNEALRRAVSDLYMLITDTEEGPYPYAGIPWFSTVFGRDALITAFETLWFDPEIARGVLRHLAANQATTIDPQADAEPGKILHEVRRGEMAELGEVPFRRYYGSIDSTPLFVMLAGAYFERTYDLATAQELWPKIEAALEWMDQHGDRDGDGFLEYARRNDKGLINQGWKDSYDSVFHADGALAVGPIALVEVQAYAYGALNGAARIAAALGHAARAVMLENKAQALQQALDRCFFDEGLGTYVLALDGAKKPCRVRTSNAGHVLFAGAALPERATSVAKALMATTSFSGWGIRTVDFRETRYNPMSYHNGSVWPHDNALIAAGLARYGLRREAAAIFEGLFAASVHMDLRRLPELFCGFSRQRNTAPTTYPVACVPQAWATAAPLSLIQSVLGLGFDFEPPRISFHQPMMPDFLEEIELRKIALGDAFADVALRRSGNEAAVHLLSRRGNIRVLTAA